jgi:hypothetical protein
VAERMSRGHLACYNLDLILSGFPLSLGLRSDGSYSILKNVTRWDSKRRVMQQEMFSPTRVTRVIFKLLERLEVVSWE